MINSVFEGDETRVNLSETMAAESIEDLGPHANHSISPSRNIRSSHVAITSSSSRSCEEDRNSLRDPIANDQLNEAHLQQAV